MAVSNRVQLSRERIAAEAVEIIDRDGLEGLSMRRLGAALGVEAMSLYHYVANKEDLLDAVVTQLYNEIELPPIENPAEWRDVVRASLRSFHQVLVDHPAALSLFSARGLGVEAGFITRHRGFMLLRAAGIDPVQAYSGYSFAVSYVMGYAGEAFRAGKERSEPEELPQELLDDPHFGEFTEAQRSISSDELFEEGVELVIEALTTRFGLC